MCRSYVVHTPCTRVGTLVGPAVGVLLGWDVGERLGTMLGPWATVWTSLAAVVSAMSVYNDSVVIIVLCFTSLTLKSS